MGQEFEKPQSPEAFPEKIKLLFESKGEAGKIAEEFWQAMPQGNQLSWVDDWTQELTVGDRTKVRKGFPRGEERGRWVLVIQGNHQPLSKEAEDWIREKGPEFGLNI